MEDGDQAKWVVDSASDCTSTFDVVAASVVNSGSASFTFGEDVQTLLLCYRFNFLTSGGSTTGYILHSSIRVSVVQFGTAAPVATASSCSTNVTIPGVGFSSLASLAPSTSR